MQTGLIALVHEIVLENELPAKALAEEIGKPYSTLLREINPYDRGAKLGVETLLHIMLRTRNAAPLAYMADMLGYSLVAKSAARSATAPSASAGKPARREAVM